MKMPGSAVLGSNISDAPEPKQQGPVIFVLRNAKQSAGLARPAKGSPFGKDSLRPEGDVAQATEGGPLAKPSGFV